ALPVPGTCEALTAPRVPGTCQAPKRSIRLAKRQRRRSVVAELATFGVRHVPDTEVPALAQRAQVRVQDRVAGEEPYDRSEREERRERDAHLARTAAVPDEEDSARDERREHADHERHRDDAAERGAHQERE